LHHTANFKEITMRYLASATLAALGIMALTATTASAAIVCNEEGDCWHAKKRYDYRPEFHLQVYPDDWRWAEADNGKYHWREHEGPGYWRGGVWIGF
jgi:hypothetical protein